MRRAACPLRRRRGQHREPRAGLCMGRRSAAQHVKLRGASRNTRVSRSSRRGWDESHSRYVTLDRGGSVVLVVASAVGRAVEPQAVEHFCREPAWVYRVGSFLEHPLALAVAVSLQAPNHVKPLCFER
jgi:hypothetical protein